MNTPKIELDEVGTPLKFKWHKCKLETVSYGHGITTTLYSCLCLCNSF